MKSRNGGRWTDAYFFGQIRQSLRRMTMYWRAGTDYLDEIRRPNMSKEGRHRWIYPCQHCHQWFQRKEIELDHKVPCGSLRCFEDISGFCKRAFVEKDGWTALCKECHKKKTLKERNLEC